MTMFGDSESSSRATAAKLPEDRQPTTVDKRVISRALGLGEDAEEDEASRDFLLKTADTLRLEFKRILKVENLHHMRSLTRLFLDNNFIERIGGLDQLFNLTWLDMSFNRIRKIEGLESLRKLEVLALYGNAISKLENLDHLKELKVLRVGCNKYKRKRNFITALFECRLTSKDDVVYLRRLPNLRTLSFRGNPICETIGGGGGVSDDDNASADSAGDNNSAGNWETFAVALLPNLSYLECRSVTQEMREAAVAAHQGDVFRARNAEEQTREAAEKIMEEKASKQRHRAAFVASLRGLDLTKTLMEKSEEEEETLERLLSGQGFEQLKGDYLKEMASLGDAMYALGLQELSSREAEVASFEGSVRRAQRASQEKGIALVEAFLVEKEAIFEAASDLSARVEDKEADDVTAEQRVEGEALKERFSSAIKNIWSDVMAQEVTLVNQTQAALAQFETNLGAMMSSFIGEVGKLFEKARSADIRYFRRLCDLGEALEEMPYTRSNVGQNDEARVTSLIAHCHDGRQEWLEEEEKRLRAATSNWVVEFLRKFSRRERRRGRNRVLELSHFVDVCRGEEDELDVLPPLPPSSTTAGVDTSGSSPLGHAGRDHDEVDCKHWAGTVVGLKSST